MFNASFSDLRCRVVWISSLAWVLAAGGVVIAQMPAVETNPNIERIKQLAGQWEGTVIRFDAGTGEGSEANPAVVSYRVTAAGTAVIETLFEGTEHEMVSVYHMDGDRLMLTHYCAMGNQPRLGMEDPNDPETLSFIFVDGSNMKSEDEPHIHGASIKFVGNDHIRADWMSYAQGKPAGVAKLDLRRKK